MANKQLFILDGHALCYRAFYAVRELTNSKGEATNAVFGFVNMLRKILKAYDPEYITVCFDAKGPTLRQQQYADYKIQRPSMPDDLRAQIPIIKNILAAYNIPCFELEGYEADDLIATFARTLTAHDLDVVIVSEDKDLYQLLNKQVKMFSIRQDALLDHKAINKKCGYESTRIADFIGLAGDKADNIPGVDGVGEVTARNLINQFGSLEEIIKNIENIEKVRVREKIENQKEQALLSKELAVLDAAVPIDFNLEELKKNDVNREALFALFKDLEFKRFADEYAHEEKPVITANVKKLKTDKEYDDFLKEVRKRGVLAFILDEKDLYLCSERKLVFKMALSDVDKVKNVLEDKNIIKVVVDIKETLKVLNKVAVSVDNVFDCMLAGYLISPAAASYKISDMAWEFLRETVEANKPEQEIALLVSLYEWLLKELRDRSLTELFDALELPLAYVLYAMETEGVKIDLKFLSKMSKECAKDMAALTEKLYAEAGEEFNINSPKQLSKILFEKLGLPVIKKTKTGFSTDEGVLSTLALSHAFPGYVLEYRHLAKLKSTYIDALPKLVDETTERIHAQFLQTGTETGRLSSRNPNLQNIPIRTDLGRQIRKAIIPSDKDHVIVAADYSQIELRILAHLSKDENLIKAFNAGQDIHTFTASLMYDCAIEDVTKEMRYSAKRINFGIVYGMSAFGLSKDLQITPHEAQEFIDKYFIRYPGIKSFMDEQIALCEKQGYVTTLLKRRRYIPEIKSSNKNVRQFAQRQAINAPVQGSAADLIKIAMINVENEIKKRNIETKMIMTVHDELVFDVLKSEEKEVTAFVKDIMEHPIKLSVPTDVTVKVGDNWLEMESI